MCPSVWIPIVTAVVAVLGPVVAIIGWVVGYKLNRRQKRLETGLALRAQYLVDVYRRLEDSAGRATNDTELAPVRRIFESAVADIQLLGTREQIETLLKHLRESGEKGTLPTIDPVLELLRRDLRKELHLELDIPQVHQYRIKDIPGAIASSASPAVRPQV